MSNAGLRAEVSGLRARLAKIEAENSRLRREIGLIISCMVASETAVIASRNRVNKTLEETEKEMYASTDRLLKSYEVHGETERLYRLYRIIERSHKRIRELNNKKYYDFKNYRTVRKIMSGILDNFKFELIQDKVIYKAIERQQLAAPDYWLTCALISLMAWKNDRRELADRAITRALELDRKNTIIFYMLINMKAGRDETAIKWFEEYTRCELKGEDESTFLLLFSLISKKMNDELNPQMVEIIRNFINKQFLIAIEKEGFDENEVIKIIVNKLVSVGENNSFDYPYYNKYVKDENTTLKVLNYAKNNNKIYEMLAALIKVPHDEKNEYLSEYIDELIGKPSRMEKDTYDEIKYNEMIIAEKGDIEKAKAIYEEYQERSNTDFDIMKNLVEWVVAKEEKFLSKQMKLNMLALLKNFYQKGVQKYFENYRNMITNVKKVAIDDYSTDMDFDNLAGEIEKIGAFYKELTRLELLKINNVGIIVNIVLAIAAGVGGYFYLYALILVPIFIGGAIYCFFNNKKIKKDILRNMMLKEENVVKITKEMFNENKLIKDEYLKYDEISYKIDQLVNEL